MPEFSERSKKRLAECHIDLQHLFNEVIKDYDCTIITGHRGEEEQNRAYETGKSRARFGQSPHNCSPALAVDVCPYPIDYDNLDRFEELRNIVFEKAKLLHISVKHGKDFIKLVDWPHWELTDWKQLKEKLNG